MANPIPTQLSPGVNVSEIDLSTFVQPQAFNSGGMAGVFNWGPCLVATRISSESELASIFGKPTLDQSDVTNNQDFLAASNFLRYSPNLKVVRLLQVDDYNATSVEPGITWIFSTDQPTVKNEAEFRALGGFSGSAGIETKSYFKAKYPGNFGNALQVFVYDGLTGNTFQTDQTSAYRDFVIEGGYNPITVAGFSHGTVTYKAVPIVEDFLGTPIEIEAGVNDPLGMTFSTHQLNWYMVTIQTPTGYASPVQFINQAVGLGSNLNKFQILYATGTTAQNFQLTQSGLNPDGNRNNYYALELFSRRDVTTNQKIRVFNPWTEFGLQTRFFAASDTANCVDILFIDGDATNIQTTGFKRGNTANFSSIRNLSNGFYSNDQPIIATRTFIDQSTGLPDVTGLPNSFGENARPATSAFSIFSENTSMSTVIGGVEKLIFNGNFAAAAINTSVSSPRGFAQILGMTGTRTFNRSVTPGGDAASVQITFDSSGGITGIKNNLKFGIIQFGDELGTSVVETSDSFNGVRIFDKTPDTSEYAANLGGANDELSVAIIDTVGKFGPRGAILERFELLSKATDAKNLNGESIYYKDYINNNSKYVYLTRPFTFTGGGTPDSTAETTFGDIISQYKPSGTTFNRVGYYDNQLQFGQSIATDPTEGEKLQAYSIFADDDSAVDVLFVPESSNADDSTTDITALEGNIYDSVIATRKDTLFVVPTPKPASGDQHSSFTTTKAIQFRKDKLNLPANSYTMVVAGRKFFFDTFNNQIRKMSLASDVAGILASQEIPWESPAGFARGNLKNVIRLESKFSKGERDELYKNQINFFNEFNDGSGTVLFGDKTLLTKPSAFDRINVRRVFIAAEKAIAKAAKYSLFEFNDEFTRAQFRNLVIPFLRNLQAQKGIYDYKVVCDETNNTAQVINNNQFVADIYIKPAKSINFIQLNFIAVKSDFTLTTIE